MTHYLPLDYSDVSSQPLLTNFHLLKPGHEKALDVVMGHSTKTHHFVSLTQNVPH